jgi:hypothetical protein
MKALQSMYTDDTKKSLYNTFKKSLYKDVYTNQTNFLKTSSTSCLFSLDHKGDIKHAEETTRALNA